MLLKIGQVVPFSFATRSLYNAYYDALALYYSQFATPYLTVVWQPLIDDAAAIIETLGLRSQNVEDTKIRNAYMDNLPPILKDLKYKVKKCIKAGTITDSLSSFVIAAFTKSISQKSNFNFHSAYDICIAKVTSNKAALIAKGFTQLHIDSITDNHNSAWEIQQTKIDLREEISNLSINNQNILNLCIDEDKKVIEALKAMAEATSNKELLEKATQKAILSSFSPIPPKNARRRNIQKASSIIIRSNMHAKNLLQLTLLTDVEVILYRVELKNDINETGTTLHYNVKWEGKKANILGTGNYIKITNKSTSKKAVVLLKEIDVNLK
ncbi:MAG: hypothetical protein WCH34_15390 [Bacteroidota bacterium]